MRGWITTALVVTFLSGASSGFVAGRASAPETQKWTWIDAQIEVMKDRGVGKPDLDDARQIYGRFDKRVKALKAEVNDLFGDRLTALEQDTTSQIQDILDRYPAPAGGEKEK